MHGSDEYSEYNGYNANFCWEQGHMPKPKTKVAYLPLIDGTHVDPSTIMAAKGKNACQKAQGKSMFNIHSWPTTQQDSCACVLGEL